MLEPEKKAPDENDDQDDADHSTDDGSDILLSMLNILCLLGWSGGTRSCTLEVN